MPEDTPAPTPELSERFITQLNAAHGRLLGFLRVMLGNSADAEDVLQRASMTMWRKFAEFDPTLDFFDGHAPGLLELAAVLVDDVLQFLRHAAGTMHDEMAIR